MCRAAQGQDYLYRCGLYQQSDGAKCNHNRINGPAAARADRSPTAVPESRTAGGGKSRYEMKVGVTGFEPAKLASDATTYGLPTHSGNGFEEELAFQPV
jgi:hypothetical protein